METAVIIIFVLILLYMLLQTPMGYRSEQTDLPEELPVTWNFDWGGGHGFSRFQIDKGLTAD